MGPFGPYGPYPLCEATPARNTESSTVAMASETTNQTLPLGTSIETSANAPVESRLIAEIATETVPIDIEEDDNEEEDYEDLADEQEDDDNDEDNDGNDEEDEGKKFRIASQIFTVCFTNQFLIAEVPFANPPPTTEAATNAVSDPAFESIPELPDGVDPSFLAALPQEMREEVLAEHIR